jgi:non-ribosomal peptide synthetase component F
MIYTSGSTGVPKGIVITQRNICHYLRSANEVYGLNDGDVVFQGASVAFDLSMEEIWIPYLAGAALFVANPAMMADPDRLPDLMESAGVSVLDTVPTLLAMLPRDVASLRLIILGGEACPPSVAARWCRPGRTIFNSYGPTEATVVATVSEVRPGEVVTIGRPIPNYTCYVVDDALNLVDHGVEGELLIGGPGVAKGYLRRDDLTAEKFIPNPFDPEGHDRVLSRSGDAVALDHKGDILFRRGEVSDSGFLVLSGSFHIDGPPKRDGAEFMIFPHSLIGEMALLTATERPATITAREPSTVLKVTRTTFHRVLKEHPKSAMRVRASLEARLSRFTGGLASDQGLLA